ncbi:MAG: SEL1-like repeat protein [Dysgonamonadaceae bacterium]|nr:SEL1-like repeat protein [Dysgonamonadaceae bacterium]
MRTKIFGILALFLLSGAMTAQDYSKTRIFSFNDRVEFIVESCIRDASTNTATIVYYLKNNTEKPFPMEAIGYHILRDASAYCDTRIMNDRGTECELSSHTLAGEDDSSGGYINKLTLLPGIQVKGVLVISKIDPAARTFQLVNIGFKTSTYGPCMSYGMRDIPLYTLADFAEFDRKKQAAEAQALLTKAEGGDAEAQYEVGIRYKEGKGMMENPATALEWFRKSAEQGNTQAMKAVGDLYYSGTGITKDDAEALRWYEQAAGRGDADGQAMAGVLLSGGSPGVTANQDKAVKYLESSVLNGSVTGKAKLGIIFYMGTFGQPDYARALPLLQDAANEMDKEAQYFLAAMYESGRGVQENKGKAAEWFQKSVAQGYPPAERSLGYCYLQGIGVRKDVNKGVELLEKSAAGGDIPALNNLGMVYASDDYGRKDPAKTASYWKQAADKEDPTGLANMGYAYLNGIGVLKNPQTAIEYLEKAAGLGHVHSPYILGTIYKEANNLPKAFSWFEKAAAGGNANAQYEAGLMCYYGKGAPKNTKKAAEYIEKANAAGHPAAAKVWNELELWKYR